MPSRQLPLVSVITVNYNGRDFLKDCFSSLLALEYPPDRLEIIMVDNGSKDGSIAYMKKYFPKVILLKNSENNYTKSNNLGIKHAGGEYIVFINNDVRVDKRWLIHLVRFAQKSPRVGVVGSKILSMDSRLETVGHREDPNFYWGNIGWASRDQGRHDNIKEVPSICGCSVLYKKECLKNIGLFDEDFNMYLEDVDMAIRCKKRGWKLAVCTKSIIYHHLREQLRKMKWQSIGRSVTGY
ncbi:MAG: glycosyltransferase family 2 protein [Candidatus Omnitrophota bacterium]|jgi:GT2 family glycosyltransferase